MNFIGGSIIFHPFRFDRGNRKWYYAPHFHLVGFAWRGMIHKSFGKFGWFVKDVGLRNSVFQTYCYILSHCGIKKKCHSVSWIGELSYSKLRVEKEPKITQCPICQGEFVPVYYDYNGGIHPVIPPDKIYEGLVDDDGGWYPEKTMEYDPNYTFGYAPTRELNDTLQSLAESN